jgi:hypothetical protein
VVVSDEDFRILRLVVEYERIGWEHERAIGLAASRLDLRPAEVMEACDRAINPPEGMMTP